MGRSFFLTVAKDLIRSLNYVLGFIKYRNGKIKSLSRQKLTKCEKIYNV